MQTVNSPVVRLKQMLALEQRRADLQQQLDTLVQQLNELGTGLGIAKSKAIAPPVSGAPRRGRPRRRGKRGVLRETIMAALESAGEVGIKVKELASAMGAKPVNIHSWFHSALKRSKEITKISGGHYRLTKKR